MQDFRRAGHEVQELPQLFNPESPDAIMYFRSHQQLSRMQDETRELIGRVSFLETHGDAEYTEQKAENIGKLSEAYNRIEELRGLDRMNGETVSLASRAQLEAEREWSEIAKLSEMRDSGELATRYELAAQAQAEKEQRNNQIRSTLQDMNVDKQAQDAGATLNRSGIVAGDDSNQPVRTEEQLAEVTKPLREENVGLNDNGRDEPDAVAAVTQQEQQAQVGRV